MENREWVIVESGGQKIFGVLHRPTNCTEPPPIVIVMHGFASSKHGTNRSHVMLAEQLAKLGIATLRFDFRGAGDSEGTISSISLEDLIDDAVNVCEYVRQLEGVDTERVGIFGSSLGGAISVLAANRFPEIRSLVLWAPVASGELWVRDFLAQHPEFLKSDLKQSLDSYKGIPLHAEFRQQFARMSAAQAVENIPHIPLLHMHGESDQTVSLLHQQVYKMHCEEREAESRFVSYPDAEHQFGTSKVFQEAVQESLAWFKKCLGGLDEKCTARGEDSLSTRST